MAKELENVSVARVDPDKASEGKSSKEDAKDKDTEKKTSAEESSDSSAKEAESEQKEKQKAENEKDDKKDKSHPANMMKQGLKTAVAGSAKHLMILQFMAMLKAWLLQMAMAFMQSVVAATQALIALAIQIVTTISVAIGVSVAVVATGLTGIFVGVAVLAVVVVTNIANTNTAIRDDTVDKCVVDKEAFQTTDVVITAEQCEMHAKLVYSVFHVYGLADTNIAGILGNWSVESEIDPTSIEGIYDERYNPAGPRKSVAFSDLSAYTTGKVFPMYANNNTSINRSAYQADDGKYYCGLGLGQWTGPAGKQLLDFASGAGGNWYDLDVQLAFCLAPNGYRPQFFPNWKGVTESSASAAATAFAAGWEGNTALAQGARQIAAEGWLTKMASWTADVSYGNSIIAKAGSVSGAANNNAAKKALDECDEKAKGDYDNSSLAAAAVSYAYQTTDEGRGNDGTELYRRVHDNVYPGDGWYQSCDRGVACAVKWAGCDDSYPAGAVVAQLSYLVQNTDKWKEITDWGGDYHNLQPGDVMVIAGNGSIHDHTVMFVGNEAIRAKYPDAPQEETYCTVSASFNERSPGCGRWYNDLSQYRIFRNIKKEDNSPYLNAGLADFAAP